MSFWKATTLLLAKEELMKAVGIAFIVLALIGLALSHFGILGF